ncbi:MAG: FtsW/RodA/SpoVE family cell cycle protein [Parasporobacterium sp.]|nr:FtsW/RodA/SpoVE family cell cycle protein [Parasporobacterium sp.]
MTNIILVGAKYLIIVLFAYFTYISFRAQRDVPEERKKFTYNVQRALLLIVHGLGYLCIFLNVASGFITSMTVWQVLAFYGGQLLYLLFMLYVLPRFVSLSKGLNNVLCMFLTITFIIQNRLNFENSVRHFIIIVISTLGFIAIQFVCKKVKFMNRLTWVYCAVGILMLLLVLVLARVVKGAKLAIDLGFFSFQPMEFVKIIFVLFIASAFHKANNFKTIIITACMAAAHVIIVVLCKDLGSALILSVIYILMLYVATKKFRYILIGLGMAAVFGFAAFKLFSHVQVRISAWLDPWADIEQGGYQITQSLFAIGTGGWFGTGLYKGAPRYVPEVSNDFIFSAISEELGGFFGILLILLCLCFTLMIFRVAIRVDKPFYKLTAFGLGTAYAFQVFLTIGGALKFIPSTGVNLPFISNGGSSMLASMLMIGIVQALYVISEADVARERQMVADGADLSEFSGYEDVNVKKVTLQTPDEPGEMSEYYEPFEVDYKTIYYEEGRVKKIDPDEFSPYEDKVIKVDSNRFD